MRHIVGVLALDGVVPFDLSIPCDVFGRATDADGLPLYEVRVASPRRTVHSQFFDIDAPCSLEDLVGIDTLIVPGIEDVSQPVSRSAVACLRRASAGGVRIASICSGAFVLAEAGLLDGLDATTHWLAAAELARRFPRVRVNPDVLFVDNGAVLTSAGAASGIDMCLHLVRQDFGAAVAADSARKAVVQLEREGGQAQFIKGATPGSATSLAPLLEWLVKNLHRRISAADMARRAGVTGRTLTRRFQEQTGSSPLQWLLTARVRRAQALLEETDLGVERIADKVGFQTASAFRDHFLRIVQRTPTAYRKAFRTAVI